MSSAEMLRARPPSGCTYLYLSRSYFRAAVWSDKRAMIDTPLHTVLPPPDAIRAQIDALDDELRALRRLLRASRAAEQAEAARKRREALRAQGTGGPPHAA
jgi:hypothetical protein